MTDRPAQGLDQIDARTSKMLVDAIGERLRARVQPEKAELPTRLQLLLDRLRAQEAAAEDGPRPAPVSSWS
jgi:hypothetical protein